MKTNRLFFLLLLCYVQGVITNLTAQTSYTVADALKIIKVESVPFKGAIGTGIPYKSCRTTRSEIPDLLYDDVAGTLSFHAEPEQAPYIHRRINLPNGKILIMVALGGVTPYGADYLCVVDNSGRVLDTLCSSISSEYGYTKQFSIDSNYEVTVYSLIPTGDRPVLFENFSSFEAERIDVTYRIDSNGKFVKTTEVKHVPRIYTRDELDPWKSKDIWDRNEPIAN